MWEQLRQIVARIEGFAGGMDSRQWALLAVVCVLVGFFCMKGHPDRQR